MLLDAPPPPRKNSFAEICTVNSERNKTQLHYKNTHPRHQLIEVVMNNMTLLLRSCTHSIVCETTSASGKRWAILIGAFILVLPQLTSLTQIRFVCSTHLGDGATQGTQHHSAGAQGRVRGTSSRTA